MSGNKWKKVPGLGSISGGQLQGSRSSPEGQGGQCLSNPVRGRQCVFKKKNTPVECILSQFV